MVERREDNEEERGGKGGEEEEEEEEGRGLIGKVMDVGWVERGGASVWFWFWFVSDDALGGGIWPTWGPMSLI